MDGISTQPNGTHSSFSFCSMQPGSTILITMVEADMVLSWLCSVSGSCCRPMMTVSVSCGSAVGGTSVGGTGVGVTTFSITRSTGVPSTISVTTTVWIMVCGAGEAQADNSTLT